MTIEKIAGIIGAVGASCTILYSGFSFVDDRYANSDEIHSQVDQVRYDASLTSLRLEEKILTDRVAAIQQRMWKIEDRYGETLAGAPASMRDEHRQMQADLDAAKQQIKAVLESYQRGGYESSDTYYKYERPFR